MSRVFGPKGSCLRCNSAAFYLRIIGESKALRGRKMTAVRNILSFPRIPALKKMPKYHLDEISTVDVAGMVLIEGCVPRVALEAFKRLLASA